MVRKPSATPASASYETLIFFSVFMSEFRPSRSHETLERLTSFRKFTFNSKEAHSVNWGGSKLGCPFEALKFNTLITREKSIDTVERNPNKK